MADATRATASTTGGPRPPPPQSSSSSTAAAVRGHMKAKEILEEERVSQARHLPPTPSKRDAKKGCAFPSSSSSSPLGGPRSVEITAPEPLRIGIIGSSVCLSRRDVSATANAVSLCAVTAVASPDDDDDGYDDDGGSSAVVDEWRKDHGMSGDVAIMGSCDDLITSEGIVDAVYIPLPNRLRKEWVLKALSTGKHVLIDLPVSMTVSDYVDIINAAGAAGKFVMDGTMFMHHHWMENLLELISSRDGFGNVRRVDAEFCVRTDDAEMDGHVWPSAHDDALGCVGSLGWYCVCFGLIVFAEIGCGTVRSAQVLEVGTNDAGHPMDAECLVKFSKDRYMTFHCSFVHDVRQKAEVIGDVRSAVMHDFAFPRRNVASFQVRETVDPNGADREGAGAGAGAAAKVIESIDTIECGAGPPRDVMMWRTFSRLCRGIDDAVSIAKLEPPSAGWSSDGAAGAGAGAGGKRGAGWGDGPESKEAAESAAVSVQAQLIVDSLMESIRRGGEEVVLPLPEL